MGSNPNNDKEDPALDPPPPPAPLRSDPWPAPAGPGPDTVPCPLTPPLPPYSVQTRYTPRGVPTVEWKTEVGPPIPMNGAPTVVHVSSAGVSAVSMK